MARRRRTAEQAKEEILDAAQQLLLAEGPDGLRLESIAHRTGMTHPNILHHFGSMENLREALHQQVSRQLREDMLGVLSAPTGEELNLTTGIEKVFEGISNPEKGRLLAWAVSTGRDPWPDRGEFGMAQIAERVREALGIDPDQQDAVNTIVFMGFMCMVGEAVAGDAARARFGSDAALPKRDEFRAWLVMSLGRLLRE